MSTRAELGLQPDNVVMFVYATRKILGGGEEGGLPLHTPEAYINFCLGKVVSLNIYFTDIQVLATNSLHDFEQEGALIHVNSLFRNYIAEDDLRLREEMEKAGATIVKIVDKEGGVSVELKRE